MKLRSSFGSITRAFEQRKRFIAPLCPVRTENEERHENENYFLVDIDQARSLQFSRVPGPSFSPRRAPVSD